MFTLIVSLTILSWRNLAHDDWWIDFAKMGLGAVIGVLWAEWWPRGRRAHTHER